jgi:hypothetical protein
MIPAPSNRDGLVKPFDSPGDLFGRQDGSRLSDPLDGECADLARLDPGTLGKPFGRDLLSRTFSSIEMAILALGISHLSVLP